ncbi:MAG: hypothetical protein JW769_02180 [Parachlamydiales bacterium]|nr:hypothetical protein [Parachlamydiales bacterium]
MSITISSDFRNPEQLAEDRIREEIRKIPSSISDRISEVTREWNEINRDVENTLLVYPTRCCLTEEQQKINIAELYQDFQDSTKAIDDLILLGQKISLAAKQALKLQSLSRTSINAIVDMHDDWQRVSRELCSPRSSEEEI